MSVLGNLVNGLGETANTNCLMLIGGRHCPPHEPWTFGKRCHSENKMNGPGLLHKVKVHKKTSHIVWINWGHLLLTPTMEQSSKVNWLLFCAAVKVERVEVDVGCKGELISPNISMCKKTKKENRLSGGRHPENMNGWLVRQFNVLTTQSQSSTF